MPQSCCMPESELFWCFGDEPPRLVLSIEVGYGRMRTPSPELGARSSEPEISDESRNHEA